VKFVIDAQLPPDLCGWLVNRRHVAIHVTSIRSGRFPDPEIADWARRNQHVVISKDEDFVTLASAERCSAIRLRCGNLSTAKLLAWLEPRWLAIETQLREGQLMINVD
jgi:predicted nuclease of predicted toxin-antitoxin system